jgi:gluconokinase
MGVSGAGKSTIGSRLAARQGISFIDGDDLHPPENVRKMARGAPLTDEDRRPWLQAIRKAIENHSASGGSVVVACSALKESYRRALLDRLAEVRIVYLRGGREVLRHRLASRRGHFFNPGLLDSQLETLEAPWSSTSTHRSIG